MMNEKYHLSLLPITAKKTLLFKETTILFLVKGDMMVQAEGQEHAVMDGHLLIFNPNDTLTITKIFRDDCVLIQLQLDSLFFSSLYPRFFTTNFELFPKQLESGKREAIYNLRKYVAELALSHYSAETTKDLRISMNLHQIILLLIQFFQKESSYYNYHFYNEKIIEIIEYIGQNYQQPLALEQVASTFFMSPSSLSKLFKAETGYYFSHYLTNLRVRQSLKDLLHSRLNIDEISLNNGFSNSKTYRIHFKKLFGESPSIYRQHYFKADDPTVIHQPKETASLESDNRDILATLYYYAHLPQDETTDIERVETHKKLAIHTQNVRDQINAEVIIHINTLEDLLNADTQTEILVAKKAIDIRYIGIQNLFLESPESYTVYKEESLSIFSPFAKFDMVLEFLEKNQLGIYYQLSLTDYETISYFYKTDRQYFLHHIEKKKGTDFFKNWKIDCQFNHHELLNCIRAFSEVYETIQQINPFIQIGAELPLFYPNYDISDPILKDRYLKQVIPKCDFLSFQSEPNYTYEKNEIIIPNVENFNEFVFKESQNIKKRLASWQISLPLYLSQWNTLTGQSRATNGSFFRGALVLQEVLKLDLIVAGYGFWLNTDQFESSQEIKPIKFDGLELFHNYLSKRPAFHVLALASRLKGKVVALGDEFMLTKHYNNYQLLLWNVNYFPPHLSLEETFLESQSVTFRIEIPEIENNFYQVKQIDFNRYNGAIFYAYGDFNSNEPLDYESHEYLAEVSRPKMKVFDLEVNNGFDFYCILDTNAVLLLELTAIKFLPKRQNDK